MPFYFERGFKFGNEGLTFEIILFYYKSIEFILVSFKNQKF